MTTNPLLRRAFVTLVAIAAATVSLIPITSVRAVEFPDPGSPLFFQTSGAEAGLNIGDWYTSTGGGTTDHLILLPVPEDWPATQPVTIAVYDPESFDASTTLSTNDEVRGPGDVTSFRLVDPGSGTLASATFASTAATNGRWVEMATFLPVPGTVYELYSETGAGAAASNQRNDDNSWRLSFTSDPDCAVGQPVDTCSGIESGNESDDADGVPGTGDELAMGFQRASYQYRTSSSVSFWFYVDATVDATVTMHNFDIDNNGSVTYRRADGTTVSGTVSGGTVWNNSTTSDRVGDTVSTAGSTGWWRADIQASANNQFIFEVDGQVPVYFAQPPTPVVTIGIDDSDADIAEGEPHTYVIDLANTSDLTGTPGAAIGTTVSIPIPAGVLYDGCSAPAGVTCGEAGGVVTFAFAGPFAAGAVSTFSFDVTGGPGMAATIPMTATVEFSDQLGNQGAPVSATDTDATLYPDLAVTIGPDQTVGAGATAIHTVDVENVGTHVQPGTAVEVPVPPGVTFDAASSDPAWTCSDGAAAPDVCTWTLGTMEPGDAASATIAFRVPDTIASGVDGYAVSATTTGDYAEVAIANNEDSAAVTIDAEIDLAIDVIAPATYTPGSTADWTVDISNEGDQDATGVVATVIVPIDGDASIASGWTCTPDPLAGSTCTYPVGDLDAGADVTLPFPVDTDPAAIDPATLDGSVVDDGASGPEGDLSDNVDDATIAPDPMAELSVDVVVTVDPVNVGDPVEFTITVENLGPSTAAATVLVIDVPPGLGGASTPPGCTPVGSDTWQCALGDLDPGAPVSFATSGTSDVNEVTVTATATSPTDADGATDADTATANRPPTADDASATTQDRDPVNVPLPVSDPDGDDLDVTADAPEGSVTIVDGPSGPELVYTPGPTTAGVVTITYEVCDPDGLCDDAVVEVTVARAFLTAGSSCIADAAYLDYDVSLVAVAGTPTVTVTWTNGTESYSLSGLPLSGSVLWPGMEVDDLTMAPADRVAIDWPGWLLVNGFWIEADDGFAWVRGADVEVFVTVNPTSDPIPAMYPAATDDCAADADGPANRPPTGEDKSGWATAALPYSVVLLDGASDPDGDTVTVTTVTPTSGQVQIVDGVFTYTPLPDESGTVTFEVTITDGRGGTGTFTVTVEVVPVREIAGVVWVDSDSDARVDDGEDPIVGALVTVTHPGPDGVRGTDDDIVATTTTDTDGAWTIGEVPEGTVDVLVEPSGWPTQGTTTSDDFVATPYEEQLPATGADLFTVAIVASAMLAIGLMGVGWRPRRRES